MSYGLRARDGRLHGLGLLDGRGLGVFNPPAQPNYEDCQPRDVPCTQRNQVKSDAYVQAMAKAQADNNRDQCLANLALNSGTPAQTAAGLARCNAAYADAAAYSIETGTPPESVTWGAPVAAPVAKGGKVTFTSSRGSNFLQVGDTWMVAITGATPNSVVTVAGWMPSGTFPPTAQGSTDASGNFSKSGTVGTGEIGKWQQIWAVGGVASGAIVFTVAAAPASQGGGAPSGGSAAGGGAPAGGGSASDGTTAGGTTVGGLDLSKIPVWGWAIAAGAALFMMSKGGR
jgi:hypothetical protein